MQIAILTSPITVGDYRELFGNTSFNGNGPSDEFLTANNAKKVNAFKTHDRLTHALPMTMVNLFLSFKWLT